MKMPWLLALRRGYAWETASTRSRSAILLGDDIVDHIIECARWPVADECVSSPQVRDSTFHILEARAIRLLVGNVPNLGRRPEALPDEAREILDRDLPIGAA